VSDLLKQRLPVTIELTVLALAMALALAVPIGVATAYLSGGRFDGGINGATLAIISLPPFLIALFLVFAMIFHQVIVTSAVAVGGAALCIFLLVRGRSRWRDHSTAAGKRRSATFHGVGALAVAGITAWLFFAFPEFPRQGFIRLTDDRGIWENLRSAFLPALTLALTELAVFSRLLRGDMIATLKEDYILAARAKGMPSWRVLLFDALRPSSFSLMTVAGVSLGRLIGGSVLIEAIFSLPGIGTLMIDAINTQNLPVVQAGVLVVATVYVVVNAGVDIAYGWLDPRVRRGHR
jgi:peptide/nickel transport system permease protein